MKFDFKKYSIDLVAIVCFLIISIGYCYPTLEGKKLKRQDNLSWQGMAREGMAYHDSTGKDVLWTNSIFGGMPSYTIYTAASPNTNYVGNIQTLLSGVGDPAFFFFTAMLCFYILMRVLGVNKWLGIIGAFAYAFSSYNAIIIAVGHNTKMMTIAYLPAAMAGMYLIFKEKWLTGAALLSVMWTLIFTNNHFQVIYYSFIMFACFAVGMFFIALKDGRLKQFFISCLIAGGATALGIGPCLSSILTTSEYAKETMRGGTSELSGHDKKTNGGLDKEYAFRWSNGIGETFCLMIPYLYGGSSDEPAEKAPKTLAAIGGNAEALPLYWGPQPFISGPVYFGSIVCFLFVLGTLIIRSPHKWWIVAASGICIIMSWGKNFDSINYFLFDHLPYLNKFRTPSMSLVIPQFLFPMLGIWAVQELINRKDDPDMWKQVKIAAGITAGLCVLLGVGGTMFFDFTGPTDARIQPEIASLLKEDRISLAMSSSLQRAVHILIVTGLLWAFIKNKIKPAILFAGLGIMMAFDLIPVSKDYLDAKNYVDASDYEAALEPRPVDKEILKDPDPYYRVLDLSRDTYNDAVQAYFHKCIGGYSPAKMERYQDLIDRQMSRGYNPQVLNMLNTKYVITADRKGQPGIQPNPARCGNAWFVDEVKWANTADEEMDALNVPMPGDSTATTAGFQPKKTAVMRTNFKEDMGNYVFGKDSSAYVKLARYGLDDISFTSSNSKDGLAVFSDIYYSQGWKAYVDGKETPIMKVDYVLRAIKIPAGSNHNIEFHFRPDSFYKGQKVTMVCSILIVLLAICSFYPLIKKGQGAA